MVDSLFIRNFKSIRSMAINPGRVNIFIGKYNTGKSNIIDALGLLSALGNFPNQAGFIYKVVRAKSFSELYFFKDITGPLIIMTNHGGVVGVRNNLLVFGFSEPVSGNTVEAVYELLQSKIQGMMDGRKLVEIVGDVFDKHGISVDIWLFGLERGLGFGSKYFDAFSSFKKYIFDPDVIFSEDYFAYEEYVHLRPPDGRNLYYMLEYYPQIREFLQEILEDYGLKLVRDVENRKVMLMKKEGIEDTLVLLPFYLTADTIQRILFYYAAIKSNGHSIIIFEEPDVYIYPFYIETLAREIVDGATNQFFITTHNPYFVNGILNYAYETGKIDELGLYITDMKDHATFVRRLNEEEISKIVEEGIDILLNLDEFIKT